MNSFSTFGGDDTGFLDPALSGFSCFLDFSLPVCGSSIQFLNILGSLFSGHSECLASDGDLPRHAFLLMVRTPNRSLQPTTSRCTTQLSYD